jgi:ABC-type transport system involved in multi-copper enzyme maturation permease subunit
VNLSRPYAVFSADCTYNLRRPFYYIWLVVMIWNAWLLSIGEWIIRSVDTAVGTQKSFVNSEFQIAFAFALMSVLFVGLFTAIAAGTPLLRDAQHGVGAIIHATPLRPREYVWGKFVAALATSLGVILVFVVILILLNEVVPNPAAADIHGPFRLRNYLMPALCFVVPAVVFMAGVSFAIAEFTRRVVLVYLFPVVVVLVAMNGLYAWYPPDASPGFTALMQSIDPGGFRWLKQTWLMVDRGVTFYNTGSIRYDASFLLGRLGLAVIGLVSVALSARHFARHHARTPDWGTKGRKAQLPATPAAPLPTQTLDTLAMTLSKPGFLRQTWNVAVFELKEVAAQPWLYLFIVVIAVLLMAADRTGQGPMHVQQIYTSGLLAVERMGGLSVLVCFLLLFTNTESLHREVQTRFSPLSYSTPVPTSSWILGKAIVNLAVAGLAVLAAFLTLAAFILVHGEAPLELSPFFWTWVCCMLPTFGFWTAMVIASYCVLRNRMATYGVAVALLVATGWYVFNDKITWLTNWLLIDSLVWSDFGVFEIDRSALILNRLLYLSLVPLLLAVAAARFPRRAADEHGGRAGKRASAIWRLALFAIPPAVLALVLWTKVEQGFEGSVAKNAEKDYWRQNVGTPWNDRLPDRTLIDIDVRFEPERRFFRLEGSYGLVNRQDSALYQIPLSGIGRWRGLQWTLNGRTFTPENRSGLFVFALDPPLGPREKASIGFSYEGEILPGISKNGGPLQLGEFVLSSGIVLTGRNPRFVPVVGYVDSIGVDDENRYEPRDPGPHYWEGVTPGGIDRSLLDTRIRIDVPKDYFATSMGVLAEELESGDRRTFVWKSDYPLRVFNIVAGKWAAKQGTASTVYYLPKHPYNIGSMVEALDGARQYYSEWFGPYPWKELRMSEFPGLSQYARGNPTNIFFSENLGFLTKDAMNERFAFGISPFGITAHEAAHQWWGHIVSPGEGPGAIVLAEGMAHFSTMCLIEKMKGEAQSQAFRRHIESYYGENRFVTSERPLLRTTGHRPTDSTVIYDKGAWVFWMMRHLLGEQRMNEGLRSFVRTWHGSLDHPVLEDFVAEMRTFAPDPQAYDAFVQQWFFQVAMPEFRYVSKPEKRSASRGWEVRARVKNVGNATMPVDVAATRGDRLADATGYAEARTQVTLAPEQEQDILLRCDFEPERLVVDPDLQVFQLQRNAARFRFPK